MAAKTPPHKEYPAWTQSRYQQFVRSALRRAWSKWPPKFEVLRNARKTVSGKRHRFEYQCSSCKKWFKATEVQVDHISSVGSDKDWNVFIERLLVGVDKLQVLCKPCHVIKTAEEKSNGTKSKATKVKPRNSTTKKSVRGRK